MKCFLGAHGTGKTTLIQEIRKRRANYYVTDAFSRPIREASSKLVKEAQGELTLFQQQILNFELMMWAQENYYNYDFVITTRSLFDSLIFARLLTPGVSTLDIQRHLSLNKHKITKIFYLPIEFPLQQDGIRFGSELQKAYDVEIYKLIKEFDLRNVVYLSGSVEERMKQLLPHLNYIREPEPIHS